MYRKSGQESTDLYSEDQVKRVLNGAGIRIESEVDSDFIVFCPYHNNHRTPAGEVSKERGTFFCFACHESRSFIDFVISMTNKTYFEAIRMIDSAKERDDLVSSIDKMLDEKEGVPPFDELMIKRLHNNALESERAMRYYNYRSISENSVRRFQLGYSDKQDMVVTPVHSPDGSCYYGFVGRSIEGKEFKNTSGHWRSQTLFNLHRARRFSTVHVIESNFDAIRLDQQGANAVATLGGYVSKKQKELLTKNFNSIILIKDNDDGGDKMEANMQSLGDRLTVIGIPKRFKDVGNMSDDDIQHLLKITQDPILAIY
jgi:predicted CXXCH cytochrome family protein